MEQRVSFTSGNVEGELSDSHDILPDGLIIIVVRGIAPSASPSTLDEVPDDLSLSEYSLLYTSLVTQGVTVTALVKPHYV